MAKVRIELNSKGVQELLKSKEIQSELKRHADATVASLGDGYQSDIHVGRNRANASVSAVTWEAYEDNLKTNAVLKALK